MKDTSILLPLAGLALVLAAGCASPSMSKPAAEVTNITVDFKDADRFTDARSSFSGSTDEGYLDILSSHVKQSAARYVKADQKLAVTITDVDLAGDITPRGGAGNDVRVVKDIYRPRITLTFKLTAADGSVVKEGDRTLVDSFFMNNIGVVGRDEPLYYDKAMLTDWVKNEFGK